jgi:acetylglutamate kinase
MKIAVELPESELVEICEVTGISKKGPAIRKLISDSLQLRKRARISAKFLTGEWSAELESIKSSRANDRKKSHTISEAWRD